MKIVFDVEKRDETTGKTYYPNIEYEFSDEEAKDILSKTKYAHEIKKVERKEKLETVENVENKVEKSVKKTTIKKTTKKDN